MAVQAMKPLLHQIEGARFLAERQYALLADAPRVGKTGAAIIAADLEMCKRIGVITTASGRPVWERAFRVWSGFGRSVETLYPGGGRSLTGTADVSIAGWSSANLGLPFRDLDLLIVDESHYAKNPTTVRTVAVFGATKGLDRVLGLCDRAERVWCLTGTPIPNAPNDLWPMLRAIAPERLTDEFGPGDVTRYEDFLYRYCVVRKKAISRWTKIDVVVGGRNLEELRGRLKGFWLRRTQEDVGITAPIYDLMPLYLGAGVRRAIEEAIPEAEDILAAAETGETKHLDMHLGTLRRLTGTVKAEGVAQAVKDEFDGGLDRVVIMAWHMDTLDALARALDRFGTVRVDGSTPARAREAAVDQFSAEGGPRVFLGQITACGEAIDLSASAELIFAESSFVPKDMAQAALRVTNIGQKRQPRVRVAALEGSIDEALQAILLRKMQTIREVLKA